MSKHRDSTYRASRFDRWVNVKNRQHAAFSCVMEQLAEPWRAYPIRARAVMLGCGAAGASCVLPDINGRTDMPESVYKVIELIGTSKESWRRPHPRRSAALENPCATSVSPRSSNWIHRFLSVAGSIS